MALSSSTSNSKRPRSPLLFAVGAAILSLLWLAYAIFGGHWASWIAGRIPADANVPGLGHVVDLTAFVQARICESLLLLTAIGLCIAVAVAAHRVLIRMQLSERLGRWRWVALALLLCMEASALCALASSTWVYWWLLYDGPGTHRLTMYNLKRVPLPELRPQTVLVGSSQAMFQVDIDLLNEMRGPDARTIELGFAAANAFDLLLLQRQFAAAKPQQIVAYLSEINFYSGVSGSLYGMFMGLPGFVDWYRLGGSRFAVGRQAVFAAIGTVFPLFRARDALARQVLGRAVMRVEEDQLRIAKPRDPEQLATLLAKNYRMGPAADFLKTAFDLFVQRAVANGATVTVCMGQLNPILSAHLDPAIRDDFRAYLRGLAARHAPHIILLEESELPLQVAADYDDLVHANHGARERFTRRLAELLATPRRQATGGSDH